MSYGMAQTQPLPYVKTGAYPSISAAEYSGSTRLSGMAFADDKTRTNSDKAEAAKGQNLSVRTDAQLDSLTQQMVEESVSEMIRQAKISAESSIHEFVEKNLAQLQLSADSLHALKAAKTAF